MCIAMELQDANLISFVTAMNVPGSEYNKIEIFSVDEGEIIKRVETNPMIQDEVKSYINGVTGLYGRIRAFPVGGYIIRIPLEPPEKVENYWLNDFGITSINQVFILFPKEERPYLLVLDNNRRPIFCNFNGKTDKLLEYLDFQLDE